MEETVLIKSVHEEVDRKKALIILGVAALVVGVMENIIHYDDLEGFFGEGLWVGVGAFLLFAALFFLFKRMAENCELTVTENLVSFRRMGGFFGEKKCKKSVDIPLDSVSAVGLGALKSIHIGSSSGAIRFYYLKNRDMIHQVLSRLLIERQRKPGAAAPAGESE